jgi:multicomponent Na+:H+ antiporter subunit G
MGPHDIVISMLLAFGVGIELLCCLGLWAMRRTFDRLHYVGPAVVLGTPALVVAVVIEEGFSSAGAKAVVIAVVLLLSGSVVTHATARAIHRASVRPGEAEKAR